MKNLYILLLCTLLFSSSNINAGTLTWVHADSGLPGVPVNVFAVKGDTLFAGTFTNGVYKSINNGGSWTHIGLSNLGITSITLSGTTIFAGSIVPFANTSLGVYRSSDNGGSWVQDGLNNMSVYTFAMVGANIFAGTNNGLYRSTNNGDSWAQIGLANLFVYPIAVFGTDMFAGTDSGVYRSTNTGNTWTKSDSGLQYSVESIAAVGTTIFAATAETSSPNANVGGIYRSTDRGDTWIQSGLANLFDMALSVSGSTIFAATSGGGVYRSTDLGNTWIQSGLTNETMTTLAIIDTSLFGAALNGIYRADISQFTPVHEPLPISPLLTLSVQPNPVRDEMTVSYNAPGAKAELELYNILGKREMSASVDRVGETIFNVAALPAGMYLLTLRTAAATKTQPVMVVR